MEKQCQACQLKRTNDLPDTHYSETESPGLYQEEHFDWEEILQSEFGSLVASGFFGFFVFVFADCTDTS